MAMLGTMKSGEGESAQAESGQLAQLLPIEPATYQQHQSQHNRHGQGAEQGGHPRIHPLHAHLEQ